MAKFSPSAFVGALSGTIGGQTARLAKSGQVLAARQPRRKSLSTQQLQNQSDFARACALWRQLDDDTHRAWFVAAQAMPRRDRLGATRTLGGFQLFAGQAAFGGGTPYATSYLPPVFTTPPISTLTLAPSGSDFLLTWALASNPGVLTRFHVSGYRPGKIGIINQSTYWTRLYTTSSAYTGTLTINPPSWPSGLAYASGEGIRIRIRACSLNHWIGSPVEISATF